MLKCCLLPFRRRAHTYTFNVRNCSHASYHDTPRAGAITLQTLASGYDFIEVVHCSSLTPGLLSRRYAINDASADWSAAEAQVVNLAKGGKSMVVSVKSTVTAGQKRKSGDAEAGNEDKSGGGKEKKSRRSIKKAKR